MSNGQPWYTNPSASLPYKLCRTYHSNNRNAEPFQSMAFFPWKKSSLESLWEGSLNSEEYLADWNNMVDDFFDAIVTGGDNSVHIFFVTRALKPICMKLPPDNDGIKPLPTDCVQVAWALRSTEPFEPLVIFSRSNVLYIYNVRRKGIASYLRGHGGTITSIAVHPTNVHLFCTTSRDYSTRIYDLSLPPVEEPKNPCWPPGTGPSRAGPAHGLHAIEIEGRGIGRCIMVLLGGRSGGHQAAVLGAAFHSRLPLIATCGLDRVVKIWHVNPTNSDILAREDKPLFSSGRIHKARVLTVTWLQHDLLATHSAPAPLRKFPDDPESKEHYLEPGTLVIWRWLSMDRFFPPHVADDLKQSILRGCASDYQESSSFKVISAVLFPEVPNQYIAPIVDIVTSQSNDPLALFTTSNSNTLSILNLAHMPILAPPTFPVPDLTLAGQAENLHLGEDRDDRPGQVSRALPPATGWNIEIQTDNSKDGEGRQLMACTMGMGGRVIIGVGTKGSVWVWGRKE